MMKQIAIATLCYLGVTLSAVAGSCPNARPTDSPEFCPSFKVAAECYCTASGVPGFMCKDMQSIYNRMMTVFGNLKRACDYQKYTTSQDCVDNWNCYMTGGLDSQSRSCSSTRKACAVS